MALWETVKFRFCFQRYLFINTFVGPQTTTQTIKVAAAALQKQPYRNRRGNGRCGRRSSLRGRCRCRRHAPGVSGGGALAVDRDGVGVGAGLAPARGSDAGAECVCKFAMVISQKTPSALLGSA